MNSISIAIKISAHSCEVESLTTRLNLIPTHLHRAGENYIIRTPVGEVKKSYGTDYWEYREEFKTNEWVQELIDKFIEDLVLPRKEVLKEMAAQCSIEFFVGVNYDGEVNPGFHFGLRQIELLSYINAELDMDLYCFQHKAL